MGCYEHNRFVWYSLHDTRSFARLLAPLPLADTAWDNVGVLLQAPYPEENKGDKVMLAVDLTTDVVEEILDRGDVSVLVVYHPYVRWLSRDANSYFVESSSVASRVSLSMTHSNTVYCASSVQILVSTPPIRL